MARRILPAPGPQRATLTRGVRSTLTSRGARRRGLLSELQGEALPVTPLSTPSGFGWTPSYTISRVGSGASSTFTTDFSFDATKDAVDGTIYVDSTSGSNSNGGTSRADALRSLSNAITAANALAVPTVRILVRPGRYYRFNGSSLNDHFNGVAPTCNLMIEPDTFYAGDVYVLGNHGATIAFTQYLTTGCYSSTTSVGTAGSRTVVDFANLDAYGDPIGLRRVLTVVSTLDPTPELLAADSLYGRGAYYRNPSSGTLWVRLPSGRAPDADMVILTDSANNFILDNVATRKAWLDQLRIYGSDSAAAISGSGATVTHTVYARQCSFNSCATNTAAGGFSLKVGGCTAYLDRCRANYNGFDGFSYKGNTIAAQSGRAIEIDCVSLHNGASGGGANNASTLHDACAAISVNGVYGPSENRTVHDIATSQRWMLGSSITAPIDTTSVSGLVKAGNGAAEATKIWLDAVRLGAVSGSQFHLSCDAAAQIKYANMDLSGAVLDGTTANITSYTP